MRAQTGRLLIMLLACSGVGAARPVLAVGNVLLPDENSNYTSPVLPYESPKTPGSSKAEPDATAPQSSPATGTSGNPATAAVKPPASDAVCDVCEAGDGSPEAGGFSPAPKDLVSPAVKLPTITIPDMKPVAVSVDGADAMRLPTTVIKLPEIPVIAQSGDAKLPHPLAINFGAKELSNNDINKIYRSLGLAKGTIQSDCTLHVNGSLITDKGAYNFDADSNMQAHTNYDGSIKTLSVNWVARCKATELPPYQGYVKQLGNNYMVDLNFVLCKATDADAQAAGAGVTRSDKGLGSCEFK